MSTTHDPLADLAAMEGVPSAVTAARDAADAVLRDRGMRQVPAEQSAKALLAGARDSATLALQDPSTGETIHESDDVRRAVEAGSVRISTQLIDLAADIRSQPSRVIARAHTIVAKGLVDVGRIDADGLGQVRPDCRERVSGVSELLSMPTTASPVVVGAIAHAEIMAPQPFELVSGIVARAVDHMVLIQAGIDPRAVLLPETAHLVAGRAYHRALAEYSTGTADGVRAWIIHCCDALTHGAEQSPMGAAPRFRDDKV